MTKVFTIGLDGATFDLIKPWIEEGRLPNLARLVKEGASGDLESVIHPLTAPAWTSFMTGKNPGKHGVFDFIFRKPGTYDIQLVNSGTRDSGTLWRILGESGKRVGVINVPLNFPPEKVNGFLISWMDAPGSDSRFTYPDDLYSELKRNIGEYRITVDFHVPLERYVNELYELIENRAEATEYLMDNHEWDYFITLFSATDFAQHAFWKYMDESHPGHRPEDKARYGHVIREVYERIDRRVGRLLEKLDDDTITLVMSDHGAGPLKKAVNLNRWLYENGWMAPGGSGENGKGLKNLFRETMSRSFTAMKKNLPQKLKGQLKQFFPDMRNRVESYLVSSRIDWRNTQAFSLGAYGNIWINLKGRDPEGIVEPGEEYEALCDAIISGLYELKDPDTGGRVVTKVYRRDELYHGAYVDRAPDLLVRWKDYAYHSRQRFGSDENSIFESRQTMPLCDLEMNGFHTLNGIVILRGKHIKKGTEIRGAHITDLAPTILYLMGVPVPDDMDGRVLTEAVEDTFSKSNTVRFRSGASDGKREAGDVYSDEDADTIRERLQGLGYMD